MELFHEKNLRLFIRYKDGVKPEENTGSPNISKLSLTENILIKSCWRFKINISYRMTPFSPTYKGTH